MARFVTVRTVLLALLVLAGVGLVFTRQAEATPPKTVTAHFPRAVSIYEGSDVRILGVTVGEVVDVTPEGESVRVEMTYDGEYDLPADAKAVIVTPTLVADRFVQLTPVYTDGPTMKDDGDIPMEDDRVGVPVELDRIYAALRDLTVTLGPNGVNADGTLNHLVQAGAKALDGQGARANQTLRDLAAAAGTFADGSGNLFATVEQLAIFTSTLAENDKLVRAFLADLSDVSGQLADERGELQATLAAVADAVGTVRSFVRDNREALVTDVRKLSRVVRAIASERDSIDTALKVAPVAIGNLVLAYNSESGSIGSRIGISGNAFDADGFLCSIVQQSDLPVVSKKLACQLFEGLLEPVEDGLPPLPPGGELPGLPGVPGVPGVPGLPGQNGRAATPAASRTGAAPSTGAYTSPEPPTFAELLAGEGS